MTLLPRLAIGFTVFLAAPALHAEGLGLGETALSARAVGPEVARSSFLKDGDGCPGEAAACRRSAYLVPGDVVVLGETAGAYGCVSFIGEGGRASTGWMALSALRPVPEVPADWAGQWQSGPEQSIAITQEGGKLRLRGDATWGASDPARVRRGGVNIGEFTARAAPEGNRLAFTAGEETLPYEGGDDYDCRLRMERLGPYLAVRDTGNCGGHNVSFTGLYRRKPGRG
jgi:hypothetical protein